ncbi:MAG: hypothetical protein J4G12_02245 [Gemmatimonadetes bacterium]|nr:hypothetical protein [Gemmatimonadota bacterium]
MTRISPGAKGCTNGPPAEMLSQYGAGELEHRSGDSIRDHLEECHECRREVEAWRTLSGILGDLPTAPPPSGLVDQVLDRTPHRPVVPRLPVFEKAARGAEAGRRGLLGRSWLVAGSKLLSPLSKALRGDEHLDSGLVEDLADSVAAAAGAIQAESHTLECELCADKLGRARATVHILDRLGHLETPPGFTDRVMCAVEEAATASERASLPDRAMRRLRRLSVSSVVPDTMEGWGRLGGLALTPAVCIGLVAHTLIAHPTLTLSDLLAYASLRITELGTGLASELTDSATGLVGALSTSLAWVVTGVALYTLVCLLSARTIYLWARPIDGGKTRVPD